MTEASTPDNDTLVLADIGDGGILRLTLNAPKSRNALSEAMMSALSAALADAAADPAVRVIVIGANGPVFCAGHHLKEMTAAREDPVNAGDRGRAYFTRVMAQCSALMSSIPAHPKPVIAEVAGTRSRLPAGGKLRFGLCRRGGEFRHAGRAYRPVLFHPDGRPVAQCRGQARNGNAADGRSLSGAPRR